MGHAIHLPATLLALFVVWLSRLHATCAGTSTADATCHAAGWTALEAVRPPLATVSPPVPQAHVLIGVKTSVVHGAMARHAIRETWGNRSWLPARVRVVFLGCAPDLSAFNASEATRVRRAIATERDRFDGDLLVDELASCRDAYSDLVNKVLAFFQWSAAHGRHDANAKTFLMVTDDDIYLRVDELLALLDDPETPARRYYAGQVWAVQYRRPIDPRRFAGDERTFLSYDHYAMNQLPPFAYGPHYLLSTDVAHFIGQNRAFFRGVGGNPATRDSVGTFDDVSVALWLLAMQVHPRHIERFGNLRDAICRNDFVSYADLSADAIYQIHRNVESRRRVCHGFSYESWIKPQVSSRVAEYVDAKARHLDTWDSLVNAYRAYRITHLHDILVAVKMARSDSPTNVQVALDYFPATNTFFHYCEILTSHLTRHLHVLSGEFVFVCEQLRSTLLEQIEANLVHQGFRRSIFALLLHNLRNSVPVPVFKVAVTADTRYGLVVIENLLTQAYAGMELQVYDEATYDEAERDPDIVIFTTANSSSVEVAQETIRMFARKYTSRLVLFQPREIVLLNEPAIDERLLVVTSAFLTQTLPLARHLYLPLGSTAFGSSKSHSPTDLLQPYDVATTTHRPATFRLRQFCVDDYAPNQCDHPHRAYFFNLLNALDRVDVAGACLLPGRMALRNGSLAESITPQSAFYLSQKSERYEHFKFTIAFEDVVNVPGHVGDTIIAAFLAGSIPIYYGHSPTVKTLFNAKAFIDCGSFPSLRVCAKHVLAVHSSPPLSDAMRQEAPIKNITAFYEAFSWHPDVVTMINQGRLQRNETTSAVQTLSEKLKLLLDNAP